jgi:hypothetical protein
MTCSAVSRFSKLVESVTYPYFYIFDLPSESNLLANSGIRLTADLGGDGMVRLEMDCKILGKCQ